GIDLFSTEEIIWTTKVKAHLLRSFKELVTNKNLAKYGFGSPVKKLSFGSIEMVPDQELIKKTIEERK
ncbi:unnamed protein product, partial [Ilex paraguariensis]